MQKSVDHFLFCMFSTHDIVQRLTVKLAISCVASSLVRNDASVSICTFYRLLVIASRPKNDSLCVVLLCIRSSE